MEGGNGPGVARGGGEVLGEMVRADGKKIGVEIRDRDRGRRNLDHDAEGRAATRHAGGRKAHYLLIEKTARPGELVWNRDHRQHRFDSPVSRRASSAAELDAEPFRPRERKAHSSQAKERIGLR